jgi:glycosyltransferase involved in cell wall biosynthesis
MESQYPKISIVTPSLNQAQYIEEAIISVLAQEYAHFEHIIIDGGSTDGTIEILKKYSHLTWISEQDNGQSDAINKGLARISGDIVGWLNCDDFYLPGTFIKVADELSAEYPDAIYSNSRYVDESGNITAEQITQSASKWMSLFRCYIPSETFFFKRSILRDKILIDPGFHICMDMEFFAHILYKGYKVKKVNDFFAHFRWHSSNKSLQNPTTRKIESGEQLIIFSRYSGFATSFKIINMGLNWLLDLSCGIYRLFCRILKIGVYS